MTNKLDHVTKTSKKSDNTDKVRPRRIRTCYDDDHELKQEHGYDP